MADEIIEIDEQEVETDADDSLDTVPESEAEEEADNTTEDPEPQRPTETPQQKEARLQRQLKQLHKKHPELGQKAPAPETGGMNEVEALLLEVKGIQDSEDVELYEKWKSETGRQPREILNSPIFQKELKELKADRTAREAIPSSTKRHGGQSDSLARAVARFEKDGTLPDDFELRSAVTNALVAKSSSNKPSWKS